MNFSYSYSLYKKRNISLTQTCLVSGECPQIDDDKKCPPPEELSNACLLDADCDEKFSYCSDGCQLVGPDQETIGKSIISKINRKVEKYVIFLVLFVLPDTNFPKIVEKN